MVQFQNNFKKQNVMAISFYRCETCGNIVVKFHDSGVTPDCCGHKMTLLTPKTEEEKDGTSEKHLPVLENYDGKVLVVKVGSAPHPMKSEHYIHFIVLENEHGLQKRTLKPDCMPGACFDICHDTPVAVYEYCNVHGLWKTSMSKAIARSCDSDCYKEHEAKHCKTEKQGCETKKDACETKGLSCETKKEDCSTMDRILGRCKK